MNLIGCNKRTAVEYVEVIKSFYTLPMFLSLEVNRRQLEDEGKSYYDKYAGPSSLREHYPAIEEGQDNNRPPPPLQTWLCRLVMEKDKQAEEKEQTTQKE